MLRSWTLLVAASASWAQGDPKLFDYDRSAPLDYKETLVKTLDGVSVFEASFASPRGGRVPCYLVAPARRGTYAGIVWQHGGGQDKQWFLPDAVELAKSGAVSVLLDSPFNRPAELRPKYDGDDVAQARAVFAQVAVDARRALDVLEARGDVDPARIGYAGLSFGAMMGGTLAGVDPRFKAFVLMVGLEGFGRHYRESTADQIIQMRRKMTSEKLDKLVAGISPVDSKHYIGKATVPLLFQAARFDLGVSVEQTYDWFAMAGGDRKELRWYDSGHMLNDRQAAADRLEWLRKQLKIR